MLSDYLIKKPYKEDYNTVEEYQDAVEEYRYRKGYLSDLTILEPSAGKGDILDFLKDGYCNQDNLHACAGRNWLPDDEMEQYNAERKEQTETARKQFWEMLDTTKALPVSVN